MFFLPGQLTLTANATYHDFSIPPSLTAEITITAILIDFYGNPVVDAPISFVGTGVAEWLEVGYENYSNFGMDSIANNSDFGDGGTTGDLLDNCFTWRDYGLDRIAGTNDMGEGNNKHDGFDTDGDGVPDAWEACEPFEDFGQDGEDGTNDEGEGNKQWDGYSMIGCDPVVLTDKDGYARITAVFNRELCIWQATDEETGLCTFEDFTASISSTLLIPQITTSDPLDIQLVRTQTTDCP